MTLADALVVSRALVSDLERGDVEEARNDAVAALMAVFDLLNERKQRLSMLREVAVAAVEESSKGEG